MGINTFAGMEDTNMMIPVFTTAYLPPVSYFKTLVKTGKAMIEIHDHYNKQSYRNRCEIYGANGKQVLTIPVKKMHGNRTKVKDIQLDYETNWQKNHWKSIESAYRSSAFFEHFEDILMPFYEKKYHFLIDFNTEMLKTILDIMELGIDLEFTERFIHDYEHPYFDCREAFHPKSHYIRKNINDHIIPYHQVFSDKYGFLPNLSVIDLLFNEGMQANSILTKEQNNP